MLIIIRSSGQVLCRGIPAIVSAGQETVPHRAPEALAELPPASLNALTILLETWHRIAENSPTNGMDAMALAVAVAPCLAWNPPPGKEARKVVTFIKCGYGVHHIASALLKLSTQYIRSPFFAPLRSPLDLLNVQGRSRLKLLAKYF